MKKRFEKKHRSDISKSRRILIRAYSIVLGIIVLASLSSICLNLYNNYYGSVELLAPVVTSYDSATTPVGWDIGFNVKRAVSAFSPSSPYYAEFCPNETGSKCYGVVPAGSGFYTIHKDFQACKVNSGNNARYDADSSNPDVPCPFYFNWRTKQNKNVANLKVDTLNFKSASTRNMYLGLQENVAGSVEYYGIDFNNLTYSPFMENIEYINFSFRAKLCYSPKIEDSTRFSRIVFYISWWNSQKKAGQQLSVDLLQFWRPLNQ